MGSRKKGTISARDSEVACLQRFTTENLFRYGCFPVSYFQLKLAKMSACAHLIALLLYCLSGA